MQQTKSQTDEYRDLNEPSPSAGWRETCADLHVKPGRPAPADPTTRDAVDDPRRPRRNRVKHALGVST